MSYGGWIDQLGNLVREGEWTTYSTMSVVVYGHPKGRQAIGSALRATAIVDSAHRVLAQGGRVPATWVGVPTHGLGSGPEECIARVKAEGTWDRTRKCARPDREIDAAKIRSRFASASGRR